MDDSLLLGLEQIPDHFSNGFMFNFRSKFDKKKSLNNWKIKQMYFSENSIVKGGVDDS